MNIVLPVPRSLSKVMLKICRGRSIGLNIQTLAWKLVEKDKQVKIPLVKKCQTKGVILVPGRYFVALIDDEFVDALLPLGELPS